jgi:DNA transposition AAA+ family ATPase
MPQIVQFEKPPADIADAEGFIATETAQDIQRSIGLVRSINGPAITMISGAPGIGKTETLLHYCRENPESALYISIAKGEGNPYHVATSVFSLFGPYQKPGTDLTVIRKQVGGYIGANRVLLVDEAQNLYQRHKLSGTKGSAFGWLVAASQESGFDLVFCGDLNLQMILAEFPHLQSRVRRPVFLKGAAEADVAALAKAGGIEGKAEIALLTAIAGLAGGLRNVENTLRMAALFAGGKAITAQHLKAATVDLKLQPKGI